MWVVIYYAPLSGGLTADVIANMETGKRLKWNGHKGIYEDFGNIYENPELLQDSV